ncbi:hypothetical protein MBLNU459_g8271t1 [Dothideomycetes sp. NU459]
MPKKHRQSFLSANPNKVLQSSSSSSSNGGKATAEEKAHISVNERLSQLRLAQASPASAERKRELAELSNQKSLPPSLGQVLGLRTSAPPKPKPGVRNRIPIHSLYRLGIMERDLQHGDLSGSLSHITLRVAAESWDAIIQDCPEYLEYLPIHLRVLLLSYLTMYGPEEGLDIESLGALFPGPADVTCLDLSGLVGWGFSLKELRKWLTRPAKEATNLGLHSSAVESVAELWDDGDTAEAPVIPLFPALNTGSHYLTRLSLANPPQSISWSDLLFLSKDLHAITHLSLAFWPLPTRTPNMTTATYVSKDGSEHAAGGTSLYSALDDDFAESAVILRQLSENTYCLRWLDLEGCSGWIGALVQGAGSPTTAIPSSTATDTREGDDNDNNNTDWEPRSIRGPDWTSAWRNVTHLTLRQPANTPLPHPSQLAKRSFQAHLSHAYPSAALAQILKEATMHFAAGSSRCDAAPPNHCAACHTSDADGRIAEGECHGEVVGAGG